MANNKLEVTIIKITESKENKSIHRLDVSGSTGSGGTAAPLLATVLPGLQLVEKLATPLVGTSCNQP